MKKTVFILSTLLIAAIVGCVLLFRSWRSTNNEYKNLSQIYQSALQRGLDQPLTIRDTVYDTVNNTVTYMYNPITTTDEVSGYVSKGVADTLAQALNVAVKKLERVTSEKIVLQDSLKAFRKTDIHGRNWLVLENDPVFDIKVNLDNDSIYSKVNISLDRAYSWYRKSIFHNKEYRAIIRARDTRVQIHDIRDVSRVPKQSRWGLSVFGGPVVTPDRFSYGVGLGLSYDLIQF